VPYTQPPASGKKSAPLTEGGSAARTLSAFPGGGEAARDREDGGGKRNPLQSNKVITKRRKGTPRSPSKPKGDLYDLKRPRQAKGSCSRGKEVTKKGDIVQKTMVENSLSGPRWLGKRIFVKLEGAP